MKGRLSGSMPAVLWTEWKSWRNRLSVERKLKLQKWEHIDWSTVSKTESTWCYVYCEIVSYRLSEFLCKLFCAAEMFRQYFFSWRKTKFAGLTYVLALCFVNTILVLWSENLFLRLILVDFFLYSAPLSSFQMKSSDCVNVFLMVCKVWRKTLHSSCIDWWVNVLTLWMLALWMILKYNDTRSENHYSSRS